MSTDINFTYIILGLLVLTIVYMIGRLHGKTKQEIPTDMIDLYRGVQELPSRVLSCVMIMTESFHLVGRLTLLALKMAIELILLK
jgi:hypothetical protein